MLAFSGTREVKEKTSNLNRIQLNNCFALGTCWLDDYDVALKPGSSYSHPMVCMNYHCQDDLSVKVDTCKTTRAEKCSPQIKDLPDFPDCCENYPC